MIIRPARLEDLPEILEIYNEAVLNTTATYDNEPRTLEHRIAWFEDHVKQIVAARQRGLRAILAGIDASNDVSIRLHAQFGFEKVAHLKQVGFKFGRWLDVVYMELLL